MFSILPWTCVLCHTTTDRRQDLCVACLQELPSITDNTANSALFFADKTYSLFHYQKPITHWILNLKFNGALIYARLLSELLIQKIETEWYHDIVLPTLLIPMPLHKKRLQERGFNQVVEIAKPIAKYFNLSLSLSHISRQFHTKAQATLSHKLREENIKNAFCIQKKLNGETIAVLDDVITTGFTLQELCNTLKKAGAGEIHVWSIARA